jgi:glycosyltransferase involved in cell wall biosynthesis
MLPLKMWEYLSAGLPVISTPLAEVRPYARELEAVRCEDDEEGFADAVFDAVLHVDGLRARRRHRATEWSWEARLREMERLLEVSLRGSAA